MGGSSGGSSSGAVSYPEYMQTQHGAWLTAMAGLITTATTGGSPYASATAYDPDCALAATNYIISLFYAEVVAMTPATDWSTYYTAAAAKYTPATITAIAAYTFTPTVSDYTFIETITANTISETLSAYTFSPTLGDYTFVPTVTNYTFVPTVTDYTFTPTITDYTFSTTIFSDAALIALVSAFQADLEARRDAMKTAYKVGALNVNSVMNSAFVLGDTLLTADVARSVAKFSADLYFQNEQKKLEFENIKAQENTAHNQNVISYENVKSQENTQHNSNVISYENTKVTNNAQYNSNIISYENAKASNVAQHNASIVSYEGIKSGNSAQHNQNKVSFEGIKSTNTNQHNSNVVSFAGTKADGTAKFNSNVISYENVKSGDKAAHNANIIKRDAVVVSHDTANRAFNSAAADAIMAKDVAHLGLYQALSQITAEANRIKIVAKVEETEKNLKYDEQDALWDLEMYQYGGNILASIAGAASGTKGKEVSTGASVLGGAMSGAAAGASIGGPIGAGIGGVIGGIAGLLS